MRGPRICPASNQLRHCTPGVRCVGLHTISSHSRPPQPGMHTHVPRLHTPDGPHPRPKLQGASSQASPAQPPVHTHVPSTQSPCAPHPKPSRHRGACTHKNVVTFRSQLSVSEAGTNALLQGAHIVAGAGVLRAQTLVGGTQVAGVAHHGRVGHRHGAATWNELCRQRRKGAMCICV